MSEIIDKKLGGDILAIVPAVFDDTNAVHLLVKVAIVLSTYGALRLHDLNLVTEAQIAAATMTYNDQGDMSMHYANQLEGDSQLSATFAIPNVYRKTLMKYVLFDSTLTDRRSMPNFKSMSWDPVLREVAIARSVHPRVIRHCLKDYPVHSFRREGAINFAQIATSYASSGDSDTDASDDEMVISI